MSVTELPGCHWPIHFQIVTLFTQTEASFLLGVGKFGLGGTFGGLGLGGGKFGGFDGGKFGGGKFGGFDGGKFGGFGLGGGKFGGFGRGFNSFH